MLYHGILMATVVMAAFAFTYGRSEDLDRAAPRFLHIGLVQLFFSRHVAANATRF